MKINPKILHSTFLLVTLFHISCERCEGDGKTYYNLSEYDKNLIPYQGKEILKFFSTSLSDTIIFQADSQWTYYRNNKNGGADCPLVHISEGRGMAFISSSNSSKIVLNQINEEDVKGFEINYNDLFTVRTTDLGYQWGIDIDSTTINDVKYYDVYTITGRVVKIKDVGVWFSEKEGILKIYSNTGDTLTKIR